MSLVDEAAEAEIDWLVRTIGAIRTARNEVGVPAGAKVSLNVHGASDQTRERLRRHEAAMQRLARLAEAEPSDVAIAKGSLQVVVDEATYALPLADVIDLDQERQRLDKELSKTLADHRQDREEAYQSAISGSRTRRCGRRAADASSGHWSAAGKSWKTRSHGSRTDVGLMTERLA